ncbi:SdrD B-like domain-containing protein [Phytoactinopolyspora halotolerans]|uniref:SD-repeat containing protein B domain-containing protein n=1 Tax=Phytoactinopolyspora halotolerans TaxID=1981512 RepID=A0A6L9SDS9_9ACTN|nr:SdrD B-like domain-containing protein [Phytoactinopolyspora halotolerans]NEE03283.1 hypothetical protein [Phytoactinopolyspora halotolerans]
MPALSISTAQAAEGDGTVTVRVIRDYNANGLWDATFGGGVEVNEPGVEGIEVELIDTEGNVVTGETGADGVATFPADASLVGGKYRVEASIPDELDYLHPAIVDPNATGDNALSSHVDFVDVSDGADADVVMGVWNPYDYTGDDPRMVSGKNHSFIVNGEPFDTDAEKSITGFGYDSARNTYIPGDHASADVINYQNPTDYSLQGETGAIWGIAAHTPDEVYAATALRRGVKFGPGGIGAIYKMDSAGNVEVLADLGGAAGSVAHMLDQGDPDFNHDPEIAVNVGKQSLGDVDVSEDGSTLYAVNLNTKELVVIDAASGAVLDERVIPAPSGVSGENWRPWGLGVKDGQIYVGGVDSQEVGGGTPSAYIWRVDEDTLSFGNAELILSEPLDDDRSVILPSGPYCPDGAPCPPSHWRAWTDDPDEWEIDYVNNAETGTRVGTHPQPILVDIDFLSSGDLAVGFEDRRALQMPHLAPRWDGGHDGALYAAIAQAGDVNRVCLVDGAYVWEGNAGCVARTLNSDTNTQPVPPEFYHGDMSWPSHPEATMGALAAVPGRVHLVTNAHSIQAGGLGPSSTQGLLWLSNETGGHDDRAVLQPAQDGAFLKGHGLMDISVMSENAPLQIGNYVWFDDDGDGVQDPDEAPVAGVTVNLYDEDGNLVATTVTNEKGEYYFDSIEHGLEPDTSYIVAIDNPGDFEEGGVLEGYGPTQHLTGQDTTGGSEVNDSNGELTDDGFAESPVTTGDWGHNDHTTDFGFSKPNAEIDKGDDQDTQADTPDDATGYEPGETRELQIPVKNTGGKKLTSVVVTDRTITGGHIEDLQCTFPGEDAATAGTFDEGAGTWEVRWEASFGDSPATWDPGVSFDCTATLTLDGTDAPHADEIEVSAEVLGTGDPVNPPPDRYHSFTGDVQVIKYDGRDGYTPELDEDGIPNKPLTSEPERDANTEDEAVTYRTEDGTSTGPQPVTFAVTNTGETWLSDITITDETLEGPDLENITCDFSTVGGPSEGTSWAGPWEPGTTFYCTGELTLDSSSDETHADEVTVEGTVLKPAPNPDYDPNDPDGNPFTDQPMTDEDGNPVPSDITVTDDDPYHADVYDPSVNIEKEDEHGNDADAPEDSTGYAPGEEREIQFPVTNNGNQDLFKVTITDETISGGQITEMSCTFPGDDTATQGEQGDGGIWSVRWAASFAEEDPAIWEPGVSFDCTATLVMDGTDAPHVDEARVHATVVDTGEEVDDPDRYHSFTGDVQVIKYDGRDGYTPEVDENGVPGKPLTSEPERDANSEDEAVAYPAEDGTSTGAQPVTFAVTNTGETWLMDIVITDETLYGPDLENITCDFSTDADGAPTSGTSWGGPMAPGATFYCTGELTLDAADEDTETHGDNVTVDAVVVKPRPNPDYDPEDPDSGDPFTDEPMTDEDGNPVPSDVEVTDDDPYHGEVSNPSTDIEKGDEKGNDADTIEDGAEYAPGEERAIEFEVTNDGNRDLKNVVVTDETVSGGQITDMSCTFPDGTTTDGVLEGQTWTVRWEASFAEEPAVWEPGVVFTCSAMLKVDGDAEVHQNIAKVYADVNGTGEPGGPGDEVPPPEDEYHAYSGEISVIKYDGNATDPADASDESKDALDPRVDADDADNAATYPIEQGGTDTGPQPVRWVVTNTGTAPLYSVVVTDTTIEGPALENVTCLFPGESEPTAGEFADGTWTITWDASTEVDDGIAQTVFEPGDTFYCEGELTLEPNQTHENHAGAEGTIVNPETHEVTEEKVEDEDPFVPRTFEPDVEIIKEGGQPDVEGGAPIGPGTVVLIPGETAQIEFTSENTGTEPLVDVVISDLVTQGDAELTDLVCEFPDGTSAEGVVVGDRLVVTWANTVGIDGADPVSSWAPISEDPEAVIDCVATLTALNKGEIHADEVRVDARGEFSGVPVEDDDEWDAVTPNVEVDKSVVGAVEPVQGETGLYDVTYEVIVTNLVPVATTYDVKDTFRFGDGIEVVDVGVTGGPEGVEILGDFDGAGQPFIAKGVPMVADDDPEYAPHVYAVTVRVDASGLLADGGSEPAAGECPEPGGPEEGGLLNEATVTFPGGEDTDTDCVPVGKPTHVKELKSAEPAGDGTWAVVYEITVSNTGEGPATYNLDDEFKFSPNVSVVEVDPVTADPSSLEVNPGFDGASDTRIATGQELLAPDDPDYTAHVYTVSVLVDVPLSFVDLEGGLEQTECTDGEGTNETEEALNNVSTLTVGDTEQRDDACAPLPSIEIEKTAGDVEVAGDGVGTITYDVVVTNSGAAAGDYDLYDQLRYGDGITVVSSEVTNTAPGDVEVEGSWTGLGAEKRSAENLVAADVPMGSKAEHTYQVTVDFELDGDNPPAESDLECPENPGDGDRGGLLNGAVVVHNDLDDSDDACKPVKPQVDIDKTVAMVRDDGDGKYTITYDVVVTNVGAVRDVYTLEDTLRFGGGIDIDRTAIVETKPGGLKVNEGWNGTSDVVIIRDQPIGVGKSHTYRVGAKVTVPSSVADDPSAFECRPVDGDEGGSGFLNTATVTGLANTADDDACDTPKTPEPPSPESPEKPEQPERPTPPGQNPPAPQGPLPGPDHPNTGAQIALYAGIALMLLGVGVLLILARRRNTTGMGTGSPE